MNSLRGRALLAACLVRAQSKLRGGPVLPLIKLRLSSSHSTSFASLNSENLSGCPRPELLPFQPKIANSVHLVGKVSEPVLSHFSPDGKYWAATVISQDDPPPFRIPIVFEGHLAHIAVAHLDENSHILVAGQLSANAAPGGLVDDQAEIQVLVNSINLVEEGFIPQKKEEGKLKYYANIKEDGDNVFNPWKNLVENPEEWWDYRSSKLSRVVNPKHPDFKRKDGSLVLWLNKAPNWLFPKLENIEFDIKVSEPKNVQQNKGGNESWKDLIENPDKWWDNRLDKKNVKAPDFKHKENGGALWLNSAPPELLSQLPPPKHEQKTVTAGNESWKDLIKNPGKWWDNRLFKKNVKAPDFKHKESGIALWLNDAPPEVLSQLPPPKGKQKSVATEGEGTLLS